jgi:hypothetical protein
VRHKHLISVDELRAAGALDVPPAWRKSLGGGRAEKSSAVQRDLFSGLSEDDAPLPEQQEATPRDSET